MRAYELTKTREYNRQLRGILPGASHYNFRDHSRGEPIRFSSGSGSRLFDIDTNEYLDLNCQFGAMILGHGHDALRQALHAQIERLISTNSADLELAAVEALRSCFPSMEMMRFGVSGTEAMLNAIRLARAFTGRQLLLRFEGHYHGSADPIMGGEASADGHPRAFRGDYYDTLGRDFAAVQGQTLLLEWNNPDLLEAVVARRRGEIAAIVMEPYCINGGGFAPDRHFIARARSICDGEGIVLIYDELITGLRLGIGGAQSRLGIAPDMTVLGKAIGGGLPIAAFGGRREIMRLFEQRKVVHGGTFNGYPLGLAAVTRVVDVLRSERPDYIDRMRDHLVAIREMLQDAARQHDIPIHVRGPDTIGLFFWGPERSRPRDYRAADVVLNTAVLARSLASFGILTCPASRIYLNTSLVEADLAFLRERLDPAFAAARSMLERLAPRPPVTSTIQPS